MIELFDDQKESLSRLKSGSILYGGVGSGKSLTGIAWYDKETFRIKPKPDLYIITTAKKRDSKEWEEDISKYFCCFIDHLPFNLKIDSWNNIKKYVEVKNSYFLFDEQRLVGYGTWTKSFLKIAKCNKWILLTATPGDTWMEYMPVMIANGYFKNKSDFICRHVVYNRFVNFPLVDRYVNEARLEEIRNDILVKMDFKRNTIPVEMRVKCNYDKELYSVVEKDRWDPFENWPVQNISQYCSLLHKIVNSDKSRIANVDRTYRSLKLKRVIIFYNYTYELDILREWCETYKIPYAEWNGQKHQDAPTTEEWVYLVQYAAGCEGWNCIDTNVVFFYSQSYSYKQMCQAKGRIDRRNTSFTEMIYYIFESDASIDRNINKCLRGKKDFNERAFYNRRLITYEKHNTYERSAA